MESVRKTAPFLLLILGHFFVDLYGSFLAPLQPYLIARHSLTLAQAGLLVSLLSFSGSFLQPLYGYWADRLRKRAFIVVGPMLAAVFMSLVTRAPNYWMLMAYLFIAGIGIAAFHPQGSSLSHARSGKRKGLGMSLFVSGGNIGAALGPVAIMSVVQMAGEEHAYFAAIPGVLLSVVLLFFCRTDADRWKSENGEPQPAIIGQLRPYLRPLGLLYGIVVFRTVVYMSFTTYTPVLLSRMGAGPMAVGTAITSFMAVGAVGGIIGGAVYDRFGGRRIFVASSLLSPVFLLLTLRAQSFLWMLVLFSLAGFTLVMTVPLSVLMGQRVVPNATSTISSLMMGFGWGVGGLMVPLIGKLADFTSLPMTLAIVGIGPILYLPLALLLPKDEPEALPVVSQKVLESNYD